MKKSGDRRIFNFIGYTVVTIITLLCILPFLLILSGSLTREDLIYIQGYRLIPEKVSFEAYKMVFDAPLLILNAFGITVSLVVLGTALGLFLTAMGGYIIQRKDFKYRNIFSFFIYFTTLFSGGLVPFYILMVTYFHMKDNYLALLLPPLLNVFYILVMKSFMQSIPDAVIESAKIDGAGELTIFIKIVLPMSSSALATIGLFIALGYWNDWYNAMLFINKQHLIPLQYYLYNIINKAEALNMLAATTGVAVADMPRESFKLAMTVVVIVPVMCVYPFVQRYFVKGVTLGAVKG